LFDIKKSLEKNEIDNTSVILNSQKKILIQPVNVYTSPQWLSQTHSMVTHLGLSNSFETKATLYTNPYRSSVG